MSAQPQREAILKLVDAVRNLLKRKKKWNQMSEHERGRHEQLNELGSKPESIKYILLLTGGARPKISTHDFEPDKFLENESLEILDIHDVVKKAQLDRTPRPQGVQIRSDQDKIIEVNYGTAPKTLITYVKASDYVDATKELGINIFRINPRLYLGHKSKYNAGMLETLGAVDTRERFHLLNNGITAVCKSYTHANGIININDFQVVNGCQTTETLWKFHVENPSSSSHVYVLLKIIETGDSEDFARRISATTNSQTAINSIDLVANDPCHQLIKQALDEGNTRFFYNSRRGEWEKASPMQKERYRVSQAEWGPRLKGVVYRKIALKELAQAFVSVCLNPASAKEQITSLFTTHRREESNYSKLFDKGKAWSEPSQILLLANLYAYVCTKVVWMDLENVDHKHKELFEELATLGRFYIIYLIYKRWREKFNEPVDTEKGLTLLSSKNSEKILSNFLKEVGGLPTLATKSLLEIKIDVEKPVDTRHLLRNSEHRTVIEKVFKRWVETHEMAKQDK
ncbi:MAG: AIPR family protein [Bacteroidetes bacterium]|nr:AIPR family protein [Bacteroidota bacterium]